MSQRSIIILVATAALLIALLVLLLVPAPEENVAAIEAVSSRIEGALAVLFPAAIHTLGVDRKDRETGL